MLTREYFDDNIAFTKVVRTKGGDALLIGGHVIEIKAESAEVATWIAQTLRGAGRNPSSFVANTAADFNASTFGALLGTASGNIA